MTRKPDGPLRFGYTTGACATAAAKAACAALLGEPWPDPVKIVLPRGETPEFPLAERDSGAGWARAAVCKDAGDDPDVTHGALIVATVRHAPTGDGVSFRAGPGVGTITKPGLPLAPGEPAINPVPRAMISAAIEEVCRVHTAPLDFEIEISVPGGEALALKTWNPRLGIEGGLSILGTTGIVRPFSCAAWIASIHRGIDVARANGVAHAVASTGATSERTAQARFDLPDWAMLDMGDFAGGLLKYLRRHPLPRLTIAGGFGKLTKLSQGALDLHSARSQVDFAALADTATTLGGDASAISQANTALEALENAGPELAALVAEGAQAAALNVLGSGHTAVDILVVSRGGVAIAMADHDGGRVV